VDGANCPVFLCFLKHLFSKSVTIKASLIREVYMAKSYAYTYSSQTDGILIGVLLVTKDKNDSGIFQGHFMYFHGEGEFSIRPFFSLKDDVIVIAEEWIRKIYPDAKRGPQREAGSQVV
jgi:hypothetical protein